MWFAEAGTATFASVLAAVPACGVRVPRPRAMLRCGGFALGGAAGAGVCGAGAPGGMAVAQRRAELAAYLDNAATTPMLPEAASAMAQVLGVDPGTWSDGLFANPSAVHRWGLAAAECVSAARRALAERIGAGESEVVFTSGGTESNHLGVLGLCRAAVRRGRHVVTTAIEHRSLLCAWDALAADGWEVARLPVGGDGRLSPEDVAAAVRRDTVLVALTHVNNETGTVQPVRQIAAAVRAAAPGAALHVDAVQALCKVDTPYAAWGVDTAAFSAHKVGGPKGTGALFVRRGTRLVPPVPGGEQEAGLRPGTENVPGIAGFGAALRADAGGGRRLTDLKLRFIEGLRSTLPGILVNGPDPADAAVAAPHIVNLSFAEVASLPAEVLLHAFEAEGIACSAGSACHARRPEPSHVLSALGLRGARLRGSLRFSLGPATRAAEIEWAIARIPVAIARLPRVAMPR